MTTAQISYFQNIADEEDKMKEQIPLEALPHYVSSLDFKFPEDTNYKESIYLDSAKRWIGPSKTAIITGICGQDASYLAELLLSNNYKVVGTKRRTSSPNYENIAAFQNNPNFELVTGDITDYTSVSGMITKYQPDEVYNLAAQSFVKASFEQPFHTFEVDTLGVVNWLEAIRQLKPDTKFYQASTSEMFGKSYSEQWCVPTEPYSNSALGRVKYQDESTPFIPQSPYGIAKLASHHMVRLYREAYKIKAACGILFNHESPRRGKEFVTRKITDYVAKLSVVRDIAEAQGDGDILNEYPKLALGNLDAHRDWGHAKDYVEAQYLILQQDVLQDYVICTGETHTVREFCKFSFAHVGLNYEDFVVVDPKFYRPAEVDYLLGDASKAKRELGWEPKHSFQQLVADMVDADIRRYS